MATIGVFDSGVGGLSVLRELMKVLPKERFIYFSDNAYCPYGNREPSFIIDRARAVSESLLHDGADVIVVACNTATAAAITILRNEYSSPCERVKELTGGRKDRVSFVGMEPAVKPAALGTKSGVIGVLATAGTLTGSKYLDMKSHYVDDVKIVEHVGKGFVELVEKGELDGERCERVVRGSVEPILEAGADTIVLGCTHYPFLAEVISRIAGPDVKIIDPAPAVARRLCNVIKEESILTGGGEGKVTLKSSGPDDALKRTFALIF